MNRNIKLMQKEENLPPAIMRAKFIVRNVLHFELALRR